jgi:hypothetical protein
MSRVTLNLKSDRRTNTTLTVQSFKEKFLYGVDISKDGEQIPDSVYEFHIQSAKEEIEKYLTCKLDLQIIKEQKNFQYNDWIQWSQIKATYPVVAGISVAGFVGSVQQITYPADWISVRKTSDELHSRLLHIVPSQAAGYYQTAAVYTGLYPNTGWGGGLNTPNYWTIEYVTGFKKLPTDIESAIGMLAAVNILSVANETLAAAYGALGASGKSMSIDGLSQSTNMYINGSTGVFSVRIRQYIDTLFGQNSLLKRLQEYYGAFVWGVA